MMRHFVFSAQIRIFASRLLKNNEHAWVSKRDNAGSVGKIQGAGVNTEAAHIVTHYEERGNHGRLQPVSRGAAG